MLEVKSAADLQNVGAKYLEHAEAGFGGVFEVHVADGKYADTKWTLGRQDKSAPQAFDVVIKGTGAAIPGPSLIKGQNVRIEGVTLTSQLFAPIEIEATKSIAISKCAFIEGRLTNEQQARPYLELRARGIGSTKSPIDVQIDNTWFVRNFEAADHSSLLGFTVVEHEPGFFHEVSIRDSAFLGNAFSSDIAFAYTMSAAIERTIFYKTWPSGVFISARTSGNITVKDSVMVAEELGHLAAVEDSPPIEVTGTKVYLRSFHGGEAPPAALKIDRAAIGDRKPIDANAGVVDAAAAMPIATPKPDLRATLDKALLLTRP